jgi:hypothetical protein
MDSSALKRGSIPDAPLVENRMPTSFVVRDSLRKWEPKLNRYTSLGTTLDVPKLDWDLVGKQVRRALRSPQWPKKLMVTGAPPPQGTEEWEPVKSTIHASFPEAEVYWMWGQGYVHVNSGTWNNFVYQQRIAKDSNEAMLNLIQDITAPPPERLLRYVSQIGPTGAGDFEDLALCDPTDASRAVLLIVTRNGDDWVVYRKLYRTDH